MLILLVESQLGIRKSGKVKTLKRLNVAYQLGLTDKKIENLSTSQLMRKIFQTKLQYNLVIPKHAKFQPVITIKE